MKNPYRNLFIHSTIIFVLSFMLNTLIHESAHAVMAKATGLHPVLHHNYVSTSGEDSASTLVKILTPAAGPLMSLLQGIIFLLLVIRNHRKSLLTLFYLWMSVLGFINIGGYLMLTPLVAYGDTGRVFSMLGAPSWIKWVVALVGLFGLIKIILNFVTHFENQLPEMEQGQPIQPGKLANALIAYPIYIGIIFTTLISLPVPTFISLMYPATSPFIVFMIYGRLRRKGQTLVGKAHYQDSIPILLIIITMLVFVISRLLVNGISI